MSSSDDDGNKVGKDTVTYVTEPQKMWEMICPPNGNFLVTSQILRFPVDPGMYEPEHGVPRERMCVSDNIMMRMFCNSQCRPRRPEVQEEEEYPHRPRPGSDRQRVLLEKGRSRVFTRPQCPLSERLQVAGLGYGPRAGKLSTTQ